MSSPRKRKRAAARPAASYADHSDLSDDASDPDHNNDANRHGHKFRPEEKLHYPALFVLEVDNGQHLNVAYFQKHGFNTPLVIRSSDGLKLRMPKADAFDVSSVRQNVGARRQIDVMDCRTQRNTTMTMKEFEQYFKGSDKKNKLYNVISLEFSNTKLAKQVAAPKVIRQIDWTDNAWPRHLKDSQTEGTNELRGMMYPKVQKYCLMSVAGCYTDFHVDFGGTSVWYHVLRGRKIFWLIPPSETNLKLYEQWTLSGRQSATFFGDIVEKCGLITLQPGNTLLIPSGWIHAVLTPEDSLVFGGNFLNSFSMERQIRVAQIEEAIKVPQKFRFPFFTELHWYVLDKYVYHLLGRTHLQLSHEERERLYGPIKEENDDSKSVSPLSSPSSVSSQFSSPLSPPTTSSPAKKRRKKEEYFHLTPYEILGIKAIVMYLHALPVTKKNVPALITNPLELIRDVRKLVELHDNDDPTMAITDIPILHWPSVKGLQNKKLKKSKTSREQQRRVPCQVCQACINDSCESIFPEDHIKDEQSKEKTDPEFQLKQCLQPILKKETLCELCNLDGWRSDPDSCIIERRDGKNELLECQQCYEVCHPFCFPDNGMDGVMVDTKPNAWNCPRCNKETKKEALSQLKKQQQFQHHPEHKPQQSKEMQPEKGQGEGPLWQEQLLLENSKQQTVQHIAPHVLNPVGTKVPTGCDANFKGPQLFVVRSKSTEPRSQLRQQLSKQIMAATPNLKSPSYVFRPPPMSDNLEDLFNRLKRSKDKKVLILEQIILLPVLKWLDAHDIASCAMVCRAWYNVCQHPILWHSLSFVHRRITPPMLSRIALRQPVELSLSFSSLSKPQLSWLLPRIPQTRTLRLSGQEFATVSSLATCNCPMLQDLDLSYVLGLNDGALYRLLADPSDSRPGLIDKKSRLKNLRSLSLRSTEISSVAIKHICQFLTDLKRLDIAQCWKMGDEALAVLASFLPPALSFLDVSHCKWISEMGLIKLMDTQHGLSTIVVGDVEVNSESLLRLAQDRQWKFNTKENILKCMRNDNNATS